MAKFKYVGDPNDRFGGPDIVSQYGKAFRKGGDAVDIPDKTDEEKANVKKLQGHSHFVDMSDKDEAKDIADRQKALEKLEADKAKAAEEQRKKDDADRKQMMANQERDARRNTFTVVAENAPRPPGTVTRDPMPDPFQGRTVEQRTPAEDHTKAGKTKG